MKNKLVRPTLDISPGDIDAWKTPRHINTIEWFASPNDVCQLMAKFQPGLDSDSDLTTALTVLSKNSGVPIASGAFRYVGFKGGSEPGVLSLNWLVQRSDEKWFVVSFMANNKTSVLEDDSLIQIASGILHQVVKLP